MSHGVQWDLYLPENAAPNDLLEELRAYLCTQRFSYVGNVIHRIGEETDFNTLADTDPDRYSMIIARRLLFLGVDLQQPHVRRVQDLLPLEVHALLSVPDSGSEPAVFAFARYPSTVLDELTGVTVETSCGIGWWGHGFCTTRDERLAHSRVIKALDFLATHGALAAIDDETYSGIQIFDPIHAGVISG